MITPVEKIECGIIMPISSVDDFHTEEHWAMLKEIYSRAITQAGYVPRPVWEQGDHEIIHAKILQNIFQNEIVICDVSTLNPNVMLELGMRITTKKPTIVTAETGTRLPFDTGIVHTEFYEPALGYLDTAPFIEKISEEISSKMAAVKNGRYKPYLETFKFETVSPDVVSVSSEMKIVGAINDLGERISSLEGKKNKASETIYKTIASRSVSSKPTAEGFRSDNALSDLLTNLNMKKTKGDVLNDIINQSEIQPELKGNVLFHPALGKGKKMAEYRGQWIVEYANGFKQLIDPPEGQGETNA